MKRLFIAVLVLTVCHFAAAGALDAPVFTVSAAWKDAPPLPSGSAQLVVEVAVEAGWHVNSNTPLDPYLIPTTVSVELPTGWRADPPVFPRHRLARFEFSEDRVAVFDGRFAVVIPLRLAPDAAWPAQLNGVVEAQACDNEQCLPPAKVPFAVALGQRASGTDEAGEKLAPLPSGSQLPNASPGLTGRFATSGLLLQLLLALVAGLALNLTPCVYPLIPITVGFFAAQQGRGRRHTWWLATVYVLGMAVTYSALGVAAALTGRLFGAALQSPWVVGAIALLMVALAASMFGVWELRVPAWATRVSGGRTGLGGALIMGLVVGLVAAPCIGPFVLGLLTYVGQRQNVLLGFVLFFALALGLGLPYLLLAASTRGLDRLPNSGAWMLGVKQLFGILLIALAVYFVKPLLPSFTAQALFAGVLAVGGAYLLLIARPGHEHPFLDRFMRLASSALVIAGIVLWPHAPSQQFGPTWQSYDEAQVDSAVEEGGAVVLDFYADWCLPCKELDERTFADPRVAARLSTFSRFKVDLTRTDENSEAVQKRFQVAGVPTIAFFVGGHEVSGERLTGFEPPAAFLARLDRVDATASRPRGVDQPTDSHP